MGKFYLFSLHFQSTYIMKMLNYLIGYFKSQTHCEQQCKAGVAFQMHEAIIVYVYICMCVCVYIYMLVCICMYVFMYILPFYVQSQGYYLLYSKLYINRVSVFRIVVFVFIYHFLLLLQSLILNCLRCHVHANSVNYTLSFCYKTESI